MFRGDNMATITKVSREAGSAYKALFACRVSNPSVKPSNYAKTPRHGRSVWSATLMRRAPMAIVIYMN
jgi:hypothetical protein